MSLQFCFEPKLRTVEVHADAEPPRRGGAAAGTLFSGVVYVVKIIEWDFSGLSFLNIVQGDHSGQENLLLTWIWDVLPSYLSNGSCRNGPPAARRAGTKSTGGFLRPEWYTVRYFSLLGRDFYLR